MPIYVGNNKIKPNGIKEAYVGNNKVYSGALPPHWETLWEGNKTFSSDSSGLSTTWISCASDENLNNFRPDCVKLRITAVLTQTSNARQRIFKGTVDYISDWGSSSSKVITTNGIYSLKPDETFDSSVTAPSGSSYGQNTIFYLQRTTTQSGSNSNQRVLFFISPSENKLKFYSCYYGDSYYAQTYCKMTLTITKIEQWQE